VLKISPIFEVEIKTEQEEPLLLLPDYLAGYHYSRAAYGSTQQEDTWTDLLASVIPMIAKLPKDCNWVTEERFSEKYLPISRDRTLD